METHDTPTDEMRIASLEAEMRQVHVTLRTLLSLTQRMNGVLEEIAPYSKRTNCIHCGRQVDIRSGRCPFNCRTKMGG